jgi:hypothetical protein
MGFWTIYRKNLGFFLNQKQQGQALPGKAESPITGKNGAGRAFALKYIHRAGALFPVTRRDTAFTGAKTAAFDPLVFYCA